MCINNHNRERERERARERERERERERTVKERLDTEKGVEEGAGGGGVVDEGLTMPAYTQAIISPQPQDL